MGIVIMPRAFCMQNLKFWLFVDPEKCFACRKRLVNQPLT